MGLLDMLVPGVGGNPFYKAFDANRGKITGAFGGMVGAGNDPRQALMGFTGGLQHGVGVDQENAIIRQKQAEDAAKIEQQKQQQNATIKWMQANYPQYVDLPVEQGFKLAMEAEGAKAGGSNAPNMSLTPLWGVDANKNPVLGQMSSTGGIQVAQMPEGVTFGKEPIRLDAGDHIILLDPVTRQNIGVIPKNGDVPTGFQQNPAGGGIAPMQGSPQAIEQAGNLAKAQSALATLDSKNQIALQAVDKALSQANWLTTGFIGGATAGLGGGPAFDLAETLKTIKSNIGFDELQTMRDNSPTGGALGQVTERELAFLQSTIASIEQAQSEGQLKENLQKLRDYFATAAGIRRQAFAQQFSGSTLAPGPRIGSGAPAATANPADLKTKYGLD